MCNHPCLPDSCLHQPLPPRLSGIDFCLFLTSSKAEPLLAWSLSRALGSKPNNTELWQYHIAASVYYSGILSTIVLPHKTDELKSVSRATAWGIICSTSVLQCRNLAEQKQRKEQSNDSRIRRCHDSETALNEMWRKPGRHFLQSAENMCTIKTWPQYVWRNGFLKKI